MSSYYRSKFGCQFDCEEEVSRWWPVVHTRQQRQTWSSLLPRWAIWYLTNCRTVYWDEDVIHEGFVEYLQQQQNRSCVDIWILFEETMNSFFSGMTALESRTWGITQCHPDCFAFSKTSKSYSAYILVFCFLFFRWACVRQILQLSYLLVLTC